MDKITREVERRVRIRKSGGDDAYSWAMFVDRREIWSGMSRSEAQWRRSQWIAEETARLNETQPESST